MKQGDKHPTLGQTAIVGRYGVGEVTSIGPVSGCGGSDLPDWIGVTPKVAGYEMQFDPHNVNLITER